MTRICLLLSVLITCNGCGERPVTFGSISGPGWMGRNIVELGLAGDSGGMSSRRRLKLLWYIKGIEDFEPDPTGYVSRKPNPFTCSFTYLCEGVRRKVVVQIDTSKGLMESGGVTSGLLLDRTYVIIVDKPGVSWIGLLENLDQAGISDAAKSEIRSASREEYRLDYRGPAPADVQGQSDP